MQAPKHEQVPLVTPAQTLSVLFAIALVLTLVVLLSDGVEPRLFTPGRET